MIDRRMVRERDCGEGILHVVLVCSGRGWYGSASPVRKSFLTISSECF